MISHPPCSPKGCVGNHLQPVSIHIGKIQKSRRCNWKNNINPAPWQVGIADVKLVCLVSNTELTCCQHSFLLNYPCSNMLFVKYFPLLVIFLCLKIHFVMDLQSIMMESSLNVLKTFSFLGIEVKRTLQKGLVIFLYLNIHFVMDLQLLMIVSLYLM